MIAKKIVRFFVFLLAALSILLACSPRPSLSEVKLQLLWTHSAQFAGFYAADQNKYYADEGLSISYLEGGATIDRWDSVLSGAAQFGLAGADELILARSQGKPVRAVATIYRRSPVVFMSLADAGITRPQDMVGKKVRSLANITPSLYAILTKVGISPDKVSLVTNLPSDLALFEKGDVPVWGVYLTGLVVSAQQAGDKLNLIFPDDYGVHFYADTIFTTDEMISTHPDLVMRFLRASLKGWVYAVENSNEVPGMIRKMNPSLDIKAENGKMSLSLPLINTGEDHIGWMKPDIWSGMESTLREQGVLTAPLGIRQVYDMQFLEQIYK